MYIIFLQFRNAFDKNVVFDVKESNFSRPTIRVQDQTKTVNLFKSIFSTRQFKEIMLKELMYVEKRDTFK